MTVFITGASSGIGAATARALARQGTSVVLTARRLTALEEVAHQVEALGGSARVIALDVHDPDAVSQAVESAWSWHQRLDGAFNNAGALGDAGSLETLSFEGLHHAFTTNTFAAAWCMRVQLSTMMRQGAGAIVNTSSIAAQVPLPLFAPYAASKAALDSFTLSAAAVAAPHGIRVNAVAPGPVDTAMARNAFGSLDDLVSTMSASLAGRPGTADEIADAVVFLLSDAARYIQGQILTVDGGHLLT